VYITLAILFFLIAMIYASVGFGGGSSYLALLSIYGIAFPEMRFIALLCNIIAVAGGTIAFIRHRQVLWKKILPLIAASIPMAFTGAIIKLHENVYFIVLGVSLIIAAVLLWKKNDVIHATDKTNAALQILTGGSIGLLSGMVGIGGGIFLSPLLNLRGWGTPRQIAAASTIFILVNSISGLAGQVSRSLHVDGKLTLILCLAVFTGGQIGSNFGAIKFDLLTVRRITAGVVMFAGVEVLLKHL
jgi:uncharacterized membrane protein YfcA